MREHRSLGRMLVAVTVQCRSAAEPIGDGIERHTVTRDEGHVVEQHRLAIRVARDGEHLLARQPHHRAEGA